MTINRFLTIIVQALLVDFILVASAILMGRWYLITIVYSLFLNIVASITNEIRPKKMGYVSLNIKGSKLNNILFLISSFIPITNVIFSVFRYQSSVCVNDEKFVEKYLGKLVNPKEAIKSYNPNSEKEPLFYAPLVEDESELKIEYENVSRKKYETSLKMESINSYIDYIALNKNLTKKQRERLLLQFRNSIIYNNKVNLSKGIIKKLQKCR